MKNIWLLLLLFSALVAEENFILLHYDSTVPLYEIGSDIEKRVSPCSTFKIVLSIIGYDTGLLLDEKTPIWDFAIGYDDDLAAWKAPMCPQSWMKYSCVWYSKILYRTLGTDTVSHYLDCMQYGNTDISGPKETFWLNSSLIISPKEQACFLQQLLLGKLPISSHAIDATKVLLMQEKLDGGWSLYGKTGYSGPQENDQELGWFVGWVEKESHCFSFAYLITSPRVDCSRRIPRVKQLLKTSKLLDR